MSSTFNDLNLFTKLGGRAFNSFVRERSSSSFFSPYESVTEGAFGAVSIATGPLISAMGGIACVLGIGIGLIKMAIAAVKGERSQIETNWKYSKNLGITLGMCIIVGVLSPLLNALALLDGLANGAINSTINHSINIICS